MVSLKAEESEVLQLGDPQFASPLNLSEVYGDGKSNFIPVGSKVRHLVELFPDRNQDDTIYFEKAGPRKKIFFDPANTRAAIVTCGGLCPGLNNVIRSIFLELYHNYGVKEVIGIKYGYSGLNPSNGMEPVLLTAEFVSEINKMGGTVLGTSRGAEDPDVIVNFLLEEKINILFCIGGDGTLKGAKSIAEAALKRNLPISIIGVPKTIDNDIKYVWKTFGFSTAVEKAKEVLNAAHNEADGHWNGIGLVKLMGRDSGFIAAAATLASQEVNITLIPEIKFELEGENGFLTVLKKRLLSRHHALVVVAEGAGQDLIEGDEPGKDASGNKKHKDIGLFLKNKIERYFAEQEIQANLKYIDPSYIIRSTPANGDDSLFCNTLGRNAVHAGMAGKTNMLIGLWHNVFVNIPIAIAVREKKKVQAESLLWQGVIESTGQPGSMTNS